MRVLNVYTNEKVRIPRKLKKVIDKQGRAIDAASKSKYGQWELFVLPDNNWLAITK